MKPTDLRKAMTRWGTIALGAMLLWGGSPCPHAWAKTIVYVTTQQSDINGERIEGFTWNGHRLAQIKGVSLEHDLNIVRMVTSPNGRFLYEEVQLDRTDPASPTYYAQHRILPDGRLRFVRYIGHVETLGGAGLSFGPSGRFAYMATPNQVLSFRVTAQGHFQYLGGTPPPFGVVDEKRSSVQSPPRWCPDGKHISFVWDDKLYRLAL
jgi:hypothetical protein